MTGRATTTESCRNETPYPFCPGCGHGLILDQLDRALRLADLDPRRVVLVSDIGCSGLSDQFFATHAFHGLHGRSITYATGIKLARPDLKPIVLIGDGGCGIGGAHLLAAARRNVGITTLVMNNFNFGMTGGQHSTTTPSGAVTSTTPDGNLERPLDVCATVAVNGAGWVWRGTCFDPDLADRIADAIAAECFALLDVWEPCTAHFTPRNRMSKNALASAFDELGLARGIIRNEPRAELASVLARHADESRGEALIRPPSLVPRFEASLTRPFRLVVAGSAGARVRSAARLVATAGVLSGLRVTQRDDYPVTVRSGHSVSELILSPAPVHYTGIVRPDALVITSRDGLARSARYRESMAPTDRVFTLPALAEIATPAAVTIVDPTRSGVRVPAASLTLACLAAAVLDLDLLPAAALEAAAQEGPSRHTRENLDAIAAGRNSSRCRNHR